MTANPRYSAAGRLLQLAIKMQGRPGGLSIPDIMSELQVSRRTAERMRNEVLHIFEYQGTEGKINPLTGLTHWRILPGQYGIDQTASKEELESLDTACQLLEQQGLNHHISQLQSLSDKLRASAARLKCLNETHDSSGREGYSSAPGPRPRIDTVLFDRLYEAVTSNRVIACRYHSHQSRDEQELILHPYGFLHGPRARYLVAHDPADSNHDYKLFVLNKIRNPVMDRGGFVRDPRFDLQKYAQASFGVYMDEPIQVTWRFSPQVAEHAQQMSFHPSEVFSMQDDGSLLVTFTASGMTEMCWHLFTWGRQVEIIEPPELKKMYRNMINEIVR